jgi:hypothetical protein
MANRLIRSEGTRGSAAKPRLVIKGMPVLLDTKGCDFAFGKSSNLSQLESVGQNSQDNWSR